MIGSNHLFAFLCVKQCESDGRTGVPDGRKEERVNIVLFEPEIPANTGNIGRTCVATGTKLHLIKPLGFSIDEKAVRRAGLDYWQYLDLQVYENYEDFCAKNPGAKVYYATTKANPSRLVP